MQEVRNRPILTERYDNIDAFVPADASAYLYASSGEERSAHSKEWEDRAGTVTFVPVEDKGAAQITLTLAGGARDAILRSSKSLSDLYRDIGCSTVYLDITGLSHHIWAPLLRAALASSLDVRIVYVEPSEYRYSPTPTEGEIFDLSERIQGISPLPGFATLSGPADNSLFVPMLGFEGTRLRFVVEEVQPAAHDIVPLIGLPGFKPEYPFHTYYANRLSLEETRSWRNVRFARANCPFSAMYVLSDIAAQYSQRVLKIAPIGTKPHALAAVLFFLLSDRAVELVYDHPIRKPTRTSGAASVSVYHVASLPFSSAKVQTTTSNSRRPTQ